MSLANEEACPFKNAEDCPFYDPANQTHTHQMSQLLKKKERDRQRALELAGEAGYELAARPSSGGAARQSSYPSMDAKPSPPTSLRSGSSRPGSISNGGNGTNYVELTLDRDPKAETTAITVHRAVIRHEKEKNPDPYTRVGFRREEMKTETLINDCNPVWEAALPPIPTPNNTNDDLEVAVFDEDYGPDEPMFRGSVPMSKVPRGRSRIFVGPDTPARYKEGHPYLLPSSPSKEKREEPTFTPAPPAERRPPERTRSLNSTPGTGNQDQDWQAIIDRLRRENNSLSEENEALKKALQSDHPADEATKAHLERVREKKRNLKRKMAENEANSARLAEELREWKARPAEVREVTVRDEEVARQLEDSEARRRKLEDEYRELMARPVEREVREVPVADEATLARLERVRNKKRDLKQRMAESDQKQARLEAELREWQSKPAEVREVAVRDDEVIRQLQEEKAERLRMEGELKVMEVKTKEDEATRARLERVREKKRNLKRKMAENEANQLRLQEELREWQSKPREVREVTVRDEEVVRQLEEAQARRDQLENDLKELQNRPVERETREVTVQDEATVAHLEKVRAKKRVMKARLAEMDAEKARLAENHSVVRSNLEKAEAGYNGMRDENERLQREYEARVDRNEYLRLERDLQDRTREVDQARRDIDGLTTRPPPPSKEKDDEIRRLKNELEYLNKTNSELLSRDQGDRSASQYENEIMVLRQQQAENLRSHQELRRLLTEAEQRGQKFAESSAWAEQERYGLQTERLRADHARRAFEQTQAQYTQALNQVLTQAEKGPAMRALPPPPGSQPPPPHASIASNPSPRQATQTYSGFFGDGNSGEILDDFGFFHNVTITFGDLLAIKQSFAKALPPGEASMDSGALATWLSRRGVSGITETNVRTMVTNVDTNNNGRVDFWEFFGVQVYRLCSLKSFNCHDFIEFITNPWHPKHLIPSPLLPTDRRQADRDELPSISKPYATSQKFD